MKPPVNVSVTAKNLYNQGVIFDESKKHTEAMRCYIEALEIEPRNPIFLCAVGDSIVLHQPSSPAKTAKALECYRRALMYDKNYLLAYSGKGYAHLVCGQYDDAIACFSGFFLNAPETPAAEDHIFLHILTWVNKGNAHFALGQYEDSIECYNKALQLDPNNRDAKNNKGLVHFALGQYCEAIQCYEEILRLVPRDIDALNNKALAHYLCGQNDKALCCYKQIMEIDNRNKMALTNRGYVYLLQKNIADAKDCFTRALSSDASYMLALQGLELIAGLQLDFTTAGEYFKRLDDCITKGGAAKAIERPGLYLARGRVLTVFGEYIRAEQIISESLKDYPNYVPLQQAQDELMKLKAAQTTENKNGEEKEKMPMTSGSAASHTEAKIAETGSNSSFFTSRVEIVPPVLKNELETPEKSSSEDAPEKNPPRVQSV